MKQKCLIVDDEYMARLLLENYVEKISDLELVGKCENALEALNILRNEKVDILFLDIQMPHLSGMELVQTLQRKPAIIFTTAYSEHAVEGFRLDAIDYLLKPFSFERFVQSVNKALNYLSFRDENLQVPENQIIKEKEINHLFVKSDGKLVKIRFDEINYIEGLKEYVSIFTEKERIITLQSLKNLEEMLPNPTFLRIHKSYIISTEKIQAIVGNQVEINKKMIPIGLTYKDALLQKLGLEE